jgi:hypothetical protein
MRTSKPPSRRSPTARPNSRSAHTHARPTRRDPRGGARACWRSCKRDPKLNLICASVENTIPTVGLNAKRSSPFPFFSMGKSSMSPRSAAQRRPAQRSYASYLGLTQTKPTSRPLTTTLTPTLSSDAKQQGAQEQATTVRDRPRRRRRRSGAQGRLWA